MEIGRSRVILGQVVSIHVKDEFIDPAGPYIRAEELHAIGRMNGLGAYVRTRGVRSFANSRRHELSASEWTKVKR